MSVPAVKVCKPSFVHDAAVVAEAVDVASVALDEQAANSAAIATVATANRRVEVNFTVFLLVANVM